MRVFAGQRAGVRAAVALVAAAGWASAQSAGVMSTSVANYGPIVAPDSIVAAWGSGLAPNTVVANTNSSGTALTLPVMLGTVELSLVDAGKATRNPGLYMVSPGQINYVLPAAAEQGAATLTVRNGSATQTGTILISNVAPGILTADGSGAGVPAAQILRVTAGGVTAYESPFQVGAGTFVPAPISLAAATDKVYVLLYGTGIRRHSLNPVIATVAGEPVPVLYAGAQAEYPGMDQVNIGPLPQSLRGKGVSDLVVTVDGVPANTVKIAVQ